MSPKMWVDIDICPLNKFPRENSSGRVQNYELTKYELNLTKALDNITQSSR